MLKGLDQIDWSQYTHAYGEATDVPDLIRALVRKEDGSKKDNAADHAIQSLYSNIWHQGTVYPATAIAVPFLIELIAANGTDHVVDVLDLLASCASGSGYLEVHGRMDSSRKHKESPEYQATIEKELQAVYNAYDAVVNGLPTYINLLDHDDPKIRVTAASTISICYTRRQQASDALKTRIQIDSDPDVTASLVGSLGYLLTYGDRRADERPQLETNDNNLFVSWVNDADFPAKARARAAQYLLQSGDDNGRRVGLNYINSLPDRPPIYLGWGLDSLYRTLSQYDLTTAIDWLTRMVTYGDIETLKRLSSLAAYTYGYYRTDPEPLFEIVAGLIFHESREIRQQALVDLIIFHELAQSLRPKLELALYNDPKKFSDITKFGTLQRLDRSSPSGFQTIDHLITHRGPKDMTVTALVNHIENYFEATNRNGLNIMDLFGALGDDGPVALNDKRTLPLLLRYIDYDDQWIRVRALRALALIDPHTHLDDLKSGLIEEIRGRPVGLIAIDTITLLAEQGIDMTDALPKLKVMAESDIRQVEMGVYNTRVLEDEQLQALAQRAIDAITSQGEQ